LPYQLDKQDTAENEKLEQKRKEQSSTELSRAVQSRVVQSSTEQSRAEKYNTAEQSRAVQNRAEQSRAEQSRAEAVPTHEVLRVYNDLVVVVVRLVVVRAESLDVLHNRTQRNRKEQDGTAITGQQSQDSNHNTAEQSTIQQSRTEQSTIHQSRTEHRSECEVSI